MQGEEPDHGRAPAALLTRADDGHTGLFTPACAREAEVNYLVSGVTPARGHICR
ncbi:alpha/beta hydrolase [Amycolatopsis sp. NBC_01488]|uniref:alpha/beta hydrolase n=1 Tax=Amycolatopsis sp. NBC_01488 TaxID=2903563 RepID=UPI002E297AAB|nr:alpha/beta hydrolase [Amycolatopsis sp. NBC_01488]